VGLTDAQAKAQGYDVQVARLPLNANGRFLTDYEGAGMRGLCKLVIETATRRLLGVHLLAPNAGDLIFGMAAMIEDEFRVEDVRQVVAAHPTIAEIFKDAFVEF
jgi:mercuric reductase